MIGLAHNLIRDFRFGLRLIKRSRVVALGVVISLGLGIGATASVFSFLDFFILRPLPVRESDRVVRLRNSTPANSMGFSHPESGDYAGSLPRIWTVRAAITGPDIYGPGRCGSGSWSSGVVRSDRV